MKHTWILATVLLVSVISGAAAAAVCTCINDTKFCREEEPSEQINMVDQGEALQDLQAINEKQDAFIISMQQLGNHTSVELQNVKNLQDDILQIINEQELSRQQKEDSQTEKIVMITNQLSSQLVSLQEQLDRMEEKSTLMYGQYQEDRLRMAQDLADIFDEIGYIDVIDGPTQVSNLYESVYYYYETPEPETEQTVEDDINEDDQPEHVHTFDQYGNCSDETCMEHQEAEVFDLIDLRRAGANSDYYYHIDWDGEINFEILYSFISPDDIEITLYSDADHMNEIPMDKIEATYTATLPEASTYYIQVHTLTEGDVEISIY